MACGPQGHLPPAGLASNQPRTGWPPGRGRGTDEKLFQQPGSRCTSSLVGGRHAHCVPQHPRRQHGDLLPGGRGAASGQAHSRRGNGRPASLLALSARCCAPTALVWLMTLRRGIRHGHYAQIVSARPGCCLHVQVVHQSLCSGRVPKLAQRLGLDLANALPGDVELPAHFFEGAGRSIA